MGNQFREALIPRLTEVVGRGGVVRGGIVLREIGGGLVRGCCCPGGSCPGGLVRGGVDVLHSHSSQHITISPCLAKTLRHVIGPNNRFRVTLNIHSHQFSVPLALESETPSTTII